MTTTQRIARDTWTTLTATLRSARAAKEAGDTARADALRAEAAELIEVRRLQGIGLHDGR